jgi:type IX secretion system PorP/SprF family membrane protein
MKNIKQLITIFLIFSVTFQLAAQRDPNYTLNTITTHYSPSLTGVFNGSFRLSTIYRSQWKSVLGSNQYQTMGALADFQVPVGDGDLFGLGLSLLEDRSSINNFRQRHLGFNGSFAKRLGSQRSSSFNHYLSGGVQLGIGQLRVSSSSFLFSTQFDGTWVDRNLPNQEGISIGDLSSQFANLDAGISYYNADKQNGDYFLVNMGLFHINTPNISFFQLDGVRENMPRRFSLSESFRYSIDNHISIIQYGSFNVQGPFTQFVFGGQMRYQQNKYSKALRIGLTTRMSSYSGDYVWDIISPTMGIELQNIQLLAAFDINISDFREVTNYRGGLELSMIYINSKSKNNRVVCPNF